MASIAIKLNPAELSNPDADLRYLIPKRIQEVCNESIVEDGYDYLDDGSMVIYLATDDPDTGVMKVIELLQNEKVLNNRILESAVIGLDKGSGYTVVFPVDFEGQTEFES
jgi:hypothetical protein